MAQCGNHEQRQRDVEYVVQESRPFGGNPLVEASGKTPGRHGKQCSRSEGQNAATTQPSSVHIRTREPHTNNKLIESTDEKRIDDPIWSEKHRVVNSPEQPDAQREKNCKAEQSRQPDPLRNRDQEWKYQTEHHFRSDGPERPVRRWRECIREKRKRKSQTPYDLVDRMFVCIGELSAQSKRRHHDKK
ncbi:hypothetical protein BDI4_290031 [Burkholderia diffusa]|nr:hypothetical protein BDI4_290031 [Burkholderia diffusa]